MVPGSTLQRLAAACGLPTVAALPVPERLDPAGLEQLLADGVGDMHYLARHRELRLEPATFHPGSRSLVLALLAYDPAPPAGSLRRSRYAAGADYHRVLRGRLAKLGALLADAAGSDDPGRAAVDSAPVNERQLALLAGLGWLGRNGLVLHPRRGSYHFLGTLFTAVVIEPLSGGQGADRCGTCRACEAACPTGALVGRRVLSTRCISYWTIEHHGVIPHDLAERFAGWWYGCDICQEACPWNRFAPPAEDARLSAGRDDGDAVLLALDPAGFERHFAGSAVRRLGYPRFRRNLLVALHSLGRSGETAPILAEGLELVRAQAAELGLATTGTGAGSAPCT